MTARPAQERVQQIAAHLYAQHVQKKPYVEFQGTASPVDLEEAYSVQFALQDLFSSGGRGPIAGHKIALTSKPMQVMCGVNHPIAGGLFGRDVRTSPCEIEAGGFQRLGVEFELAIEIGEAVATVEPPLDARTVLTIVAQCRPCFELTEARRADYGRLTAAGLAADNAWSGGVVLGSPIENWRGVNAGRLPVSLFYNDEPAMHANTSDADPFGSLAWIANHLNDFGRRLEPGQIVITGSTLKTRFPEPGDHIRYEIGGMSGVELRVL